ncbi:MAG TPA: hypothetical protein VF469_34295 [Kofleriaceae bacterium]
MARTHRTRELVAVAVLLAGGCGWLPPDSPPVPPAPPDPDAPLLHTWTITGHVLGQRALISETDAAGFHDRTIAVTAGGYTSPWSGSCSDARRGHQPRTLAEVAAEHDIAGNRAATLGLTEPVVAYQLLCATNRTPPLLLYVAGPHAVTCWSGVCYLLAR